MKTTLIFPPATDPRSPHLALPCLASVLRDAGIDTQLLDLDIDGMLSLLSASYLDKMGEKLRDKYTNGLSEHKAVKRLVDLSYILPERISDALATFHDPLKFYNPNHFNAARETLFNCLDVISATSQLPVHYNIFPIRYDIDGVNTQSLSDLLMVTKNREANLFQEFWDTKVFRELENRKPDLIGITITNRQQIIPGLMLARQLRERGNFVIIGGTVYTKFVTQLMKTPAFFEYFANGVVAYEGERALLELVYQLEENGDFNKVPNYLYLDHDRVCFTGAHVEDVNALPTPDFTGLPLDRYLTPKPVLPILFGKGCYFNHCKFCDIPYINSISKKSYRVRSPERIIDDLIELQDRFSCNHFEFTDEALSPKLLEKLADSLEPYKERRFRFVGYARLEPGFTPELCKKLARMGLRKIFFGLESGSQETLDHMDKGIKILDVPVVLKNCRDAGINFHVFSIIGFPAETEESARKTYQFFEQNAEIVDHPGNSFDIHPFGLELRTPYFEQAEQMGIQISSDALSDEFIIGVGDKWINKVGLTHEQVQNLLCEFYIRLKKIYKRYHSTDHHFWPAFEEFAILYADMYHNRGFPYKTSLPDETDSIRYRLVWNRAAIVNHISNNMLRISSRYGFADVDINTYYNLGSRTFRNVSNILEEFSGKNQSSDAKSHVRQTIDYLIEKSLIYLEPYTEKKEIVTNDIAAHR
jgi:anaerobic magnesium-protoporphyrin IX monomethyl ester cyclase